MYVLCRHGHRRVVCSVQYIISSHIGRKRTFFLKNIITSPVTIYFYFILFLYIFNFSAHGNQQGRTLDQERYLLWYHGTMCLYHVPEKSTYVSKFIYRPYVLSPLSFLRFLSFIIFLESFTPRISRIHKDSKILFLARCFCHTVRSTC